MFCFVTARLQWATRAQHTAAVLATHCWDHVASHRPKRSEVCNNQLRGPHTARWLLVLGVRAEREACHLLAGGRSPKRRTNSTATRFVLRHSAIKLRAFGLKQRATLH